MPTFHTQALIDELQATLRRQLIRTDELAAMPAEMLSAAPAPGRWSVLEVVAHLNVLSGHYHRHLQGVYAAKDNGLRLRSTFRTGFWGQRLTATMQPRTDGSIPWPMRTMARFDPSATVASQPQEWIVFRSMLVDLVALLDQARTRGLEGVRITSTLGPVLRFMPGDAFRFTVAHQERHFLQIERTLAALGPLA